MRVLGTRMSACPGESNLPELAITEAATDQLIAVLPAYLSGDILPLYRIARNRERAFHSERWCRMDHRGASRWLRVSFNGTTSTNALLRLTGPPSWFLSCYLAVVADDFDSRLATVRHRDHNRIGHPTVPGRTLERGHGGGT